MVEWNKIERQEQEQETIKNKIWKDKGGGDFRNEKKSTTWRWRCLHLRDKLKEEKSLVS